MHENCVFSSCLCIHCLACQLSWLHGTLLCVLIAFWDTLHSIIFIYILCTFIDQQMSYCYREEPPAYNDIFPQGPPVLPQMDTNNSTVTPAPIHHSTMPVQSVSVHTAPVDYPVMSPPSTAVMQNAIPLQQTTQMQQHSSTGQQDNHQVN